METVYCSACGEAMSAAALACPKCGQPNGSLSAPNTAPAFRGLQGPVLNTVSAQTSFGDAIKVFFRKYADFTGRGRRSEYWLAYLFTVIVGLPLSLLSSSIDGEAFGFFSFLSLVWSLAILIPSLALVSRRLHDADTSFGYFFIFLVPFVGVILLIIKLAQDGTPGTNRFGESNKYFA
tara:strand:+ start:261 stop:794 length:534 start_codon:yes stop_codon:yes gene_type:complete